MCPPKHVWLAIIWSCIKPCAANNNCWSIDFIWVIIMMIVGICYNTKLVYRVKLVLLQFVCFICTRARQCKQVTTFRLYYSNYITWDGPLTGDMWPLHSRCTGIGWKRGQDAREIWTLSMEILSPNINTSTWSTKVCKNYWAWFELGLRGSI